MGMFRELRRQGRQIVFSLLGVGVIAYFGFHAVEGEHGVRAYFALTYETDEARMELDTLEAKRTMLEHRVRLLRPDSLDLDMLEERARAILNVAHRDELVVLLPPGGG